MRAHGKRITNNNGRRIEVYWSDQSRATFALCLRCRWTDRVSNVTNGVQNPNVLEHECSREAMLQVLDGLRDSAERMQAVADRHPDWAEYASPDRTHAARASRYAKEADELAAEIDHEAKREDAKAYIAQPHNFACEHGHFDCANFDRGACENEVAGKYGLLEA